MQTADRNTILDKLLLLLASDLNYKLSDSELDLYTEHLGSFGLKPIRMAILAILDEKRPAGTFPPISEFQRVLKQIKEPADNYPMAL